MIIFYKRKYGGCSKEIEKLTVLSLAHLKSPVSKDVRKRFIIIIHLFTGSSGVRNCNSSLRISAVFYTSAFNIQSLGSLCTHVLHIHRWYNHIRSIIRNSSAKNCRCALLGAVSEGCYRRPANQAGMWRPRALVPRTDTVHPLHRQVSNLLRTRNYWTAV